MMKLESVYEKQGKDPFQARTPVLPMEERSERSVKGFLQTKVNFAPEDHDLDSIDEKPSREGPSKEGRSFEREVQDKDDSFLKYGKEEKEKNQDDADFTDK